MLTAEKFDNIGVDKIHFAPITCAEPIPPLI